jgi:hypothetical protein
MRLNSILASAVFAGVLPLSTASAAPLYSQNFDVDSTATWTVNPSAGANTTDYVANFFYDYSAIGVPAAPGGSTTRGLKMTANNSAAVFGGVSVSPTGQSFSGNYTVEFDIWQNYVGPLGLGGSGSTQLSEFGIGTSGTTSFWPGAATKESVSFGATIDGGSANDYRAYSSAAPTSYASGNAVYQSTGNSNNDSAAPWPTAFPAQSAPAAQLALFPGQTGTTNAGEISFKWRHVILDVNGTNVTWSVDGTNIAIVPLAGLTLGGGNILFGHADTNATSSSDANDTLLNVTLIDNVSVVPEPGSLAVFAFGAGGLLLRRRKA